MSSYHHQYYYVIFNEQRFYVATEAARDEGIAVVLTYLVFGLTKKIERKMFLMIIVFTVFLDMLHAVNLRYEFICNHGSEIPCTVNQNTAF